MYSVPILMNLFLIFSTVYICKLITNGGNILVSILCIVLLLCIAANIITSIRYIKMEKKLNQERLEHIAYWQNFYNKVKNESIKNNMD